MNDPASPSLQATTAAQTIEVAPLAGVLVVEHGERLGVSVCASLLAQLGAEIALIERRSTSSRDTSLGVRAAKALGKRSIVVRAGDAADERFVDELLRGADIVMTSTDLCPPAGYVRAPHQITCDVTAFGADGPLAGLPYSDSLVQALSGLAATTGNAAGAPTLIGFPFCEVSAGIYAAAAVLAAHRVRRTRGFGQAIDIALYDCAVSALSTFLPFHAIGKEVTRAGNAHSLAAPWNAYGAADGWVLICTATDEQWRRLCKLIERTDMAQAPGFATNAERVARRGEVDALLQAWASSQTVDECITRLAGIDIACGPILTLQQLASERNLAHRKMVRRVTQGPGPGEIEIPASPLSSSLPFANAVQRVPAPDSDRAFLRDLLEGRAHTTASVAAVDAAAPLTGLRVLEIGQYTTAPLVSRQLGALGAEVYKIEPPGGEGSRSWPPTQGDRGYFFAFSNSDKKSLELDLREDGDRSLFRALLKTADVLVENLKPGSLGRLGFSASQLSELNPRLVYCAISGFGANSAYPGRPAFDTVVQAMSGFMDLTRAEGVPMKAGISAADIMGGEFGLLAILAALEARDRTQRGRALDMSMQDAAVWATASAWNVEASAPRPTFVCCTDGYVCVDAVEPSLCAALLNPKGTRDALLEKARRAGLSAAPVCTISEVATSQQVAARKLIVEKSSADGRKWPLLNSPFRLLSTRAVVRRAIGELGEANAELHRLVADSATPEHPAPLPRKKKTGHL